MGTLCNITHPGLGKKNLLSIKYFIRQLQLKLAISLSLCTQTCKCTAYLHDAFFYIHIKTCRILSTQIWHQAPSSQEKWCRACWLLSLGSWLSIARGCKNSRNQWPDSGFVPSSRYAEDRVWRLHQPTRSWNTSTNTWVLCLQWGRFKNKIPK